MKKPGFAFITVLTTAVVLTVICFYAYGTEASRRQREQEIRAQRAVAETVEISALEAEEITIGATPVPEQKLVEMPEDAVEIICNEAHIAVLSSREEAEKVLTEYMQTLIRDEDGERTVSACFDQPVYIVDAIGDMPVSDGEAVLELLYGNLSLVPVRMERERREAEVEQVIETQYTEDASLAKDTRMVTQLGNGCSTVTLTDLTYIAGEVVTGSDPVTKILREARPSLVRIGSYRASKPNGEPGAEEGETGRENQELSLICPVTVEEPKISSYFGTRRGTMHWGIDYSAVAGTKLIAPEEGVIVWCGERGEYGFVVDIDHGNGFVSRLTHCDGVSLELHQRIFKGDTVGTLAANADGSTPVLHYELLIDGVPHNPVPYLAGIKN